MLKVQGDQKIGNEKGRLGEEISCIFLKNKGFNIINRNYRKKWGEIDIIATKKETLHFIEVKSVTFNQEKEVTREMSENTNKMGEYRPEDNVHPGKLKRISRTIQSYVMENNISPETSWFFDIITAKIDLNGKKTFIKMIENITI